jgi:sugar-specific transcriptional regulator TrmB
LLELQAAGVNEIAQKTNINRSSTYVVIEALKKRGLVSASPDKSVLRFIPASPETLLEKAQEESEKTAAVTGKIHKMLPTLRALADSQSQKSDRYKPKVVMYEGDEATKMSYHYSFGSEFRIFKDLTGMSDIVPADYIEKDATKRRKDGVKMFMISPDTKENQDIVSEYKKHKSPDQFALIPPEKFSKSKSKNIGIGIYSDRVKFASGKDKFAIYIINQEITDTLRDLFDLAWEGSKNINRKKR